jgi:hypothetical protein
MNMKQNRSTIRNKIKKLSQIAPDLKKGRSFSITRLTTIKSLCEDVAGAEQFASHFAKLAQKKLEKKIASQKEPRNELLEFKKVVEKAVVQLEMFLKNRTNESESQLLRLLLDIENLQSNYEKQKWGLVRFISSSDTLVVEYALRCVLATQEKPYWAYLLAREYTEKYDSKYGTGLLPESAPMVEEIAEFWCNYYFEKTLKEAFGK